MTATLPCAPHFLAPPRPRLNPHTLRVWLIHDWLTAFRGGEKVLLELVRIFPRARIATLFHTPGASHPEIDARVERVSFLNKIPGIHRGGHRKFLPLFPAAIRSLDLDPRCDLILSVSHAVAKNIRPPHDIPHLCYCQTPMRYIWGMADQYAPALSPKRLALSFISPYLRRLDRNTTTITRFLANSRHVAQRIRSAYRREADVIYPGINTDFFIPSTHTREDYYLIVSALVPYKRIDRAIRACLPSYSPRLAGGNASPTRKLIIIGAGPDLNHLRKLARGASNITFLGHQPDEVVRHHYQHCRAFILPGEEDFGLTPLEAQACGTPIIAYAAGGALESSPHALFFHDSLPAALTHFETAYTPPSPATLRQNALRFSWQSFRIGITTALESLLLSTARDDVTM